ncbi:MAG: hypothetical protein IKZ67_03280 [Paludibacteraceae bacterium]|nr:hypothetical protein [Paludibacteraceae bacterium]
MADLESQSFSSRQYEWADITVVIGGKDITGLRGVSYKASQEKTPIYGKGNQPIAIQKGNISYEGSIKLLQSEMETLALAGGKNGILGLEVDIVVAYGNPSNGDLIRTDVLKGVQFTEESRELNQGDGQMECELPMTFLRLQRNK